MMRKPLNAGRQSPGFTLLEVLIVIAILSIAGVMVLRIQQAGNLSFMVTNWRQDRLQQLNLLMKLLKENMEEAADDISIDGTGKIVHNSVAMQYRQGTVNDGDIIEFTINYLADDTTPGYRVFCKLGMTGGKLVYQRTPISGTLPQRLLSPPSLEIADAQDVSIEATPVFFSNDTGYEFVATQPVTPAEVETGAILVIHFNLKPPKNVKNSVMIEETLKVKVHVKAQPY